MSTDATVATATFVDIETAEFTPVVQIAPIPFGRSYLVWATGHVDITHALVDIELEVFDAKDWIQHAAGSFGPSLPFSLVVGTTLPANEDLFTVARLSARIRVGLTPDPGDSSADRAKVTARLAMLAVDTLTVQGEQVSAFDS